MKKNGWNYLVIAIGLILLGTGLILIKTISDPQGIMQALPYVCVGIGCGTFGHGMGNIISNRSLKNSPELKKKIEIEMHDERNLAISNRAKAKAYDIMVFVFSALLISFALMGVNVIAVLLLVFAYLFIIGCSVYYSEKYRKEM